ncbi:MAG TPA: hypothetical protein VLH37_05450 [Bacteroidales bacterium]|nr:hypothetical protein [Bacteroidales bacterium]
MPIRCNRLKIKQILVITVFVLTGFNAFGQTFNTTQNGSWNTSSTWLGNNRPGFTVAGNPGIVNISHQVTANQQLILGDKNDGRINILSGGRLTANNGILVDKNHWEINVSPGGQLIVAGGIRFQAGGGEGPSPDLIISGVARIAGGITGVGYIRGNGTLIVDAIGAGVTYATGPGGWAGTVVVSPDPLPIELLSFSVNAGTESVLLNWETATETNNDFFTIERSTDVQNWEILGYVDGAGNSNKPLSYSFTDSQPLEGISYYRLKQTDFDGKYEYFGPVAAQFKLSQHSLSFRVNRQFDHWVITLPGEGLHHIEVYNLQGHRLISQPAENNLTIPVQRGPVVIRVVDQNSRSASQVVN